MICCFFVSFSISWRVICVVCSLNDLSLVDGKFLALAAGKDLVVIIADAKDLVARVVLLHDVQRATTPKVPDTNRAVVRTRAENVLRQGRP